MEFVKRSIKPNNVTFDTHTEPHYDVTPGQVTFFLIWIGCFILWVAQYLGFVKLSTQKADNSSAKSDSRISGTSNGKHVEDSQSTNPLLQQNGRVVETRGRSASINSTHKPDLDPRTLEEGGKHGNTNIELSKKAVDKSDKGKGDASDVAKKFSSVKPPPTFQEFLQCVVVFGAIMIYFYLCDYRKIFPKADRVYNRDQFLFLVFLLFLVASAFTIKPNTDTILNRDQTEEWKGWMQVMFVWYHVFMAKEWYNWIRVYIAAYVWMTGFGNFSFFWVRKDFSIWRFLKMQFRLNFLVTCLCVVTSNEYILYYICAMHSYWFVSVYVFMWTLNSWNSDRKKMALKFAAYFVFNVLIFEVPMIRDNVFRPFWFILQYHTPNYSLMHEWTFRAGLDHWACFIGMLCAYNYPHFETFMKNVEKSENVVRKLATKITMVVMATLTLCCWYVLFMRRDKFEYNKIHAYTSPVPIVCFIVIRNSFPLLRQYHVTMFAWLGKITLETYLSQLHIYLQSNAKDLIRYLPEGYPFLNFSFSTIIYLFISYWLFNLTTDFSAYLIPKDMKLVVKNCLMILIIFFVPWAFLSFLHLIV